MCATFFVSSTDGDCAFWIIHAYFLSFELPTRTADVLFRPRLLFVYFGILKSDTISQTLQALIT